MPSDAERPIDAGPDAAFTLSRREFLGGTAGALVLGFVLPGITGVQCAGSGPTQVNSWLAIGRDDSVTLTIGSSEMGQGSFSGLAQILSEDLMVDYARIRTVQGGPTLARPAPVGSAIFTVGSGVTRNNYWALRDAGATARELLVQAAMLRFQDSVRANYTVHDGVITHVPSGLTLSYGQVANRAATLDPPSDAPLVPDAELAVIGQAVPRLDIPAKVDGSALYGLDVRLPGMAYAVIKHCPTVGGTLAAVPAPPSGATAVVPTQIANGTGRGAEAAGNVNAVAVVGTNTWDAWQAARSLQPSWNLPADSATMNDADFLATGEALAYTATPYVAGGANPLGTLYTVEGDAPTTEDALAASDQVVEALYTLPYVAHACMEVLNCTVDYVAGEKCDIYAPTQGSRSVLSLAMALTGLAEDQIHVHTTYLGGGLGRKAETDFVSQAIQVGMALGRPVKLMWPREEDFSHDQYRPMAVIRARGGLDTAGRITGWAYRNVSPPILGQRGVPLRATGDSQGIEGARELPYDLDPRVTEYVTHPSPIPVGFWRSVGASVNTFGVESMIDELAAAAGADPYLFRRANLTDPRWIAVLDEAAALGNWSAPLPAGHARGIAIGTAFNSIVAEVVELSQASATSIQVARVAVVLDAYLTVNPGSVDAQLVGGVVHGLNAALYGRQRFLAGVAQSRNFNRSRMIRLSEMPQVSVSVIPNPASADRSQAIGGVGELGVPTLAPALANAYFAATGVRVRALPFFPDATMGGL